MRSEEGYTLVELLTVIAILGIVMGGVATLFARGINASAAAQRRYQDQHYARLAMDKMRREIHAACTVSNPSTYNTPESSVTLYFASDGCSSGTHTVTWCTSGSGSQYTLYRSVGSTCTTSQRFAKYLTSANVFTYLPPNSYVTTLGGGTGSSAITTIAGNSTLPRLHVSLTVNRMPTKTAEQYKLVDDIAFRNGPRSCVSGGASC